MDSNTILVIVVALVFLVLALVAIFRFDKVKHNLEIFGIKIGIAGSKASETKKTRQGPVKDPGESAQNGKASIKIRGNVTGSELSAESSGDSEIEVGKDVKKTRIHAKGGK